MMATTTTTTTTTTAPTATSAPVTGEDIITAGRAISLTSTVVADWATRGTPKQREYLHGFLTAEHASRTHARHARLLKAARLPALKSFDGYDWSAIRFPDGYGRDQLTSLEFLDHAGDLVFYGDVGTGKTHLACAIVAAACHRGIPARFHTTASLVAQLRRAKDTDRLDKELATLARYQILAIDLCRYCNYADVWLRSFGGEQFWLSRFGIVTGSRGTQGLLTVAALVGPTGAI